MYRLCLVARRLGHALRGAPGRRGEHHAVAALLAQPQDGADYRRLSRAGAARYDHDLGVDGARYRLALRLGEGHLHFAFEPRYRGVRVYGFAVVWLFGDAAQVFRRVGLRVVEGGKVDGAFVLAAAGDFLDDDVSREARLLYARSRNFFRDAELFRGERGEHFARHVDVALAREVVERVVYSRRDAVGRVVRHAELLRYRVGGGEAYALHVERYLVRVGLHHLERRRAVFFEYAHRVARADAVALEEHHDLAHVALFAPRLPRRLGLRAADALDLGEAHRVVVEYLRRLRAEFLDYLARRRGAYAAYEAGA